MHLCNEAESKYSGKKCEAGYNIFKISKHLIKARNSDHAIKKSYLMRTQ